MYHWDMSEKSMLDDSNCNMQGCTGVCSENKEKQLLNREFLIETLIFKGVYKKTGGAGWRDFQRIISLYHKGTNTLLALHSCEKKCYKSCNGWFLRIDNANLSHLWVIDST